MPCVCSFFNPGSSFLLTGAFISFKLNDCQLLIILTYFVLFVPHVLSSNSFSLSLGFFFFTFSLFLLRALKMLDLLGVTLGISAMLKISESNKS